MTAPDSTPPTIAVLGLGPMGIALARSALATGHPVRVWNRSPKDLAPLGLSTAAPIVDPADPGEVDLVVICVRDHSAARPLIDALAARGTRVPVVNLSTGTPREALESADHAHRLGLTYVTGAIMVPTPMVGTPDCLVLYAGSPAVRPVVAPIVTASFGGAAEWTGADHAIPPVLDLAMLDLYFAGMYGFLHSAALAEAHGITPERFLPYATNITATLGASLPDLTSAITRRTYNSGEARLDMCLAFLEKITAASAESGVPDVLPGVVRDASRSALQSWSPDTDWDCVMEGLRRLPADLR